MEAAKAAGIDIPSCVHPAVTPMGLPHLCGEIEQRGPTGLHLSGH
jgi:hypothetical protein